jgi:hypothetical protein
MTAIPTARPTTARVAKVGLWVLQVLLAAVCALSAASPPPASSLS